MVQQASSDDDRLVPGAAPPVADPKALLAAVPGALALTDTDGRLRWWNERTASLLGTGAAVGASLQDLLGVPGAALEAGAGEPLHAPARDRWLLPRRRTLADGCRLWQLDEADAVSPRRRGDVESQLALAESLAGIGLWRHALAADRIHGNAQAWAMLGLPPRPDGMPSAELRARIHPDDRVLERASAEQALAGTGPADTELRYTRADGSWGHVLTRRVVERDEAGQAIAFLGVALDVTERATQAEHARTLARRLDLAARTAGIGYWAREGEAERAFWNEQMRQLHALAPDEPVPTLKEWLEVFLHPADRTRIGGAFRALLQEGSDQVDAELRIVRRDGSVRHLMTFAHHERDGPSPAQFGIAVDVTERRRADEALRRAEQRAALAARGAGLGTWELDLANLGVYWDAQMWALRGRPPRVLPPDADEILSFVHPDDRIGARRQLDEAAGDTEVVEHRFRVVWPDGSVHWLASRSTTIAGADGRPLRRIGVNWDVTAERSAEEERRQREAAQQANRAKSAFIARMSHELRTPLNALLGFVQLMQHAEDGAGEDPAPPERRAQRLERLQHMRAAGEHLLSLIDDVLDLASLDVGELRVASEPVPLAALVAQTLPLVEPLRQAAGVPVQVEVGTLAVQADPTRLRQVLVNLLGNACKYNRAGGAVWVDAGVEGDEVRLEVRDSGRGLSEQQLKGLFEPFNRLGAERETIPGTGIGLAITKALVQRMGGRIAVHSRAGEGSAFVLWLPVAAADAVRPPDEPATMHADAGPCAAGGCTVLYIEDNAVNALIVRQTLAQRPALHLVTAADGRSGLEAARRHRPTLVLLDMQLPDMDGLTLLQQLRADPLTAAIPCVALSANVLPEDIARARAAGVVDYWTKPLDLGAFLVAIDRLLGQAAGGTPGR